MSSVTELKEFSAFLTDQINGRPVVIFGKSRGGWYCLKVLRAIGLDVACFSDKSATADETYLGIPVLQHEVANQKFPAAVWINSLLDRENQITASRYLESEFAINAIQNMPFFLTFFMTIVGNRDVDIGAYHRNWSTYFEGNKESRLLESPTLSYVLTEKCTLNCDSCGAFVPSIGDPRTFDAKDIVSDIKSYCEAFDIVHHIALQGGEPFLHKRISEIVAQISKISNLLFVDVVTNGTISVNDRVLQDMAKNGTAIWISDYGISSPKADELTDSCDRLGIYVDRYLYDEREWYAQFPVQKQNRSESENKKTFTECVADKFQCCQIMDGKIFRCSFSNFTSRLGLIPDFPSDNADLRSDSPNKHESVRQIAMRKEPLSACDYCLGNERPRVPAGVQTERIKKSKYRYTEKSLIHVAK